MSLALCMQQPPQNQNTQLNIQNELYGRCVIDFFQFQSEYDGVDITTDLLLSNAEKEATATIVAREPGILAGYKELEYWIAQEKIPVKFGWGIKEGEKFEAKSALLSITGPIATILKTERIILNFLSRLCGIATVTQKICAQTQDTVYIAATRKTLWGMLDKKAVSIGGGLSHRLGLFDAVLAKENHLSALKNGVRTAAQKIIAALVNSPEKLGSFWEIEVETVTEFQEVLEEFENIVCPIPGVILLDNFTPEAISALLQKIDKQKLHRNGIWLEASGGITLENVSAFAKSGVDVLSLGMLTHTPKPIDLSLQIEQ